MFGHVTSWIFFDILILGLINTYYIDHAHFDGNKEGNERIDNFDTKGVKLLAAYNVQWSNKYTYIHHINIFE